MNTSESTLQENADYRADVRRNIHGLFKSLCLKHVNAILGREYIFFAWFWQFKKLHFTPFLQPFKRRQQ